MIKRRGRFGRDETQGANQLWGNARRIPRRGRCRSRKVLGRLKENDLSPGLKFFHDES